MLVRRIVLALGVGVVVLFACDGGPRDVAISVAPRPASTLPGTAPVATSLAPSQATGSTVAAPALPPPCSLADLSFDMVASTEPDVVVIAIANRGAERCEVDLATSPGVDPLMERDVWIAPAASAELRVELDTTCTEPDSIEALALGVNGDSTTVPLDGVTACALTLSALYPA